MTDHPISGAPPEFSRPVDITRLHKPELHEIEASETERRALAERFGVTEIGRLGARLTVRPVAGGPLIRVSGTFEAEVEQPCVVTLEPVRAVVADELEIEFGPSDSQPSGDLEGVDEVDLPEPLEGDTIDLGEITAQFLSVGIDPYPRTPGIELGRQSFGVDQAQNGAESGAASDNPFAVLKSLKTPKN